MPCVHDKIDSALDRWQESHWHLHQVEKNYHYTDAFRYSMNSFIRSLREVPDLISIALQNVSEFTKWHRPIKETLEKEDSVFRIIIKHRDFLVHRAALVPCSRVHIATVRGSVVKAALPFKVDLLEDSDTAINRFLERAKKVPEMVQLLAPDEIQLLSVIREWKITGIDDEIITAFRKAWSRVGEYLSEVTIFLGGKPLAYQDLECFKDPRTFYYKKYPKLTETT
jgi:hypothetical protein